MRTGTMKRLTTGLLFLAGALLLSTCTVGLGTQVDTKPPVVAVSSPSTGSVKAGTFSMTGTVSDETSLRAVTVTLVEKTADSSAGAQCGMEQFNHTQIGSYVNGELTLPVVGWLADRLEYSKLQPMN